MPLLTLLDAELAFGDLPLLDGAALNVEAGERIGLIGRNGTGKSSLLSVITGEVALDDGELKKRDGLRVIRVPQEPVLLQKESMLESLMTGQTVAKHKLEEFLHRFDLDPQIAPEKASGGERKRAALALAF